MTSPIKSFRAAHGLSLEQFARLFPRPVNKSTVLRWERKVPAERVLEIERTIGIARSVLRPDLYPKEDAA